MNRPFFHPEAEIDYLTALERYAQSDYKLAVRFQDEVETAGRKLLEANPNFLQYSLFDESNTRYVRIKDFPYLLIFRVNNDQAKVIAIHHTSRDSKYLMNRS